ncbi:MAG: Phosphoglycerate dehydrogenase [Clostridiales bacterium]|jgi:phosphoglycerate dehydrogenase-like enzyme|nr:Phosphoglycerate dehydrogenase [Clostridiales bacterium]MDF2636614.1 Phosphoglycerate dehydrogenase [Pelosinus sp.]
MGKILITPRSFSRYGEQAIDLMESKGYEVTVNTTGKPYSYEKFCELSSDVDGIILGVDTVDEQMLKGAKNLKGISRFGVGIDNINVEIADRLGIKIARAIGSNSTSVAELAVGFFFTLARNVVKNVNEVKAGKWNKASGMELRNKTVGVIGLGAIGKEVSRMSQGIGMKVIGYDPFVNKEEMKEKYNIDMKSFEEVLQESDFVTLHMPLTEENKYLMNKATLRLMKSTAYLINTARGGLVNEDDLYEALIENIIAGAAADVFSNESPSKDEKLLKLDNFILSSHIASLTVNAELNTINLATHNLLKILGK